MYTLTLIVNSSLPSFPLRDYWLPLVLFPCHLLLLMLLLFTFLNHVVILSTQLVIDTLHHWRRNQPANHHHKMTKTNPLLLNCKPKRSLRLPIVRDQYTDDEEEDEELSKLSANHLSAGLSDGPLGREQPFTPMVNREMLCSLVRYSFQQTEEQQLQFEQILQLTSMGSRERYDVELLGSMTCL